MDVMWRRILDKLSVAVGPNALLVEFLTKAEVEGWRQGHVN